MMAVAAVISGIGFACMLYRKSLLGLLAGAQLVFTGSTLVFVIAGALSGEPLKGHIFAIFILMVGLALVVCGYTLATRVFYLKRKVDMEDLKRLRG
ncbi:MAG: hypothetical protein A2583_06550 [Bdellovibrionales bacterium RIFOXYD1_FULL_53_11]|nr:MAG: hypothetical protein A2583_06550 [Bdellovibrionales bacterium RIFOXYD1_FULL_53_11]